MTDDGMWFAPKRYGLGAGLPIAWQGWALMAAHLAMIFAVVAALHRHPAATIIAVFALGVAPYPIYAARTRGGWRWRWGGED